MSVYVYVLVRAGPTEATKGIGSPGVGVIGKYVLGIGN